MSEEVRFELRGPAAWLTIDRPEARNALNPGVIAGLLEGLERAAADSAARVVVLTGAGDRAFCAGADLSALWDASAGSWSTGHFSRLLRAVRTAPLPVVARVQGVALAGGLGLAISCDLVVASENASFGTPEVNVALWPHVISAIIRRALPRTVALEMMMTGRPLDARAAERWGMVNQRVPSAKLDEAVDKLVAELASKSAAVLRLGKASFTGAEDLAFDEALVYLEGRLAENLGLEDAAEGIAAFLAKRPPEWRGR